MSSGRGVCSPALNMSYSVYVRRFFLLIQERTDRLDTFEGLIFGYHNSIQGLIASRDVQL